MLFYEPLFLFVFFPTLYLLYIAVGGRARTRFAVLLVASLFFYLWSEPLFVPIVLISCVLDYALGRGIASGTNARALLTLGILANLGILFRYKYTGFLVDNLDTLLVAGGMSPVHVGQVALPIGVSFIVFEKITYLVDIHRGRSRPAPNLSTYLLYVFFFPKLLAGPIIKYHEMDAQLVHMPRVASMDIVDGFGRFMLGVVKKTLLADTLSAGADNAFTTDLRLIGFGDAWWGVVFFTFQIYFDFSAYSDMAIGIARMLGFRLRENFDMPYISCSITEFWRRWHISLSTWIREYLYIPLGGNRVEPARQYLNLWVCFLASGLWHGAAWTYVLWGAYNGLFLMLDRLFLLRVLDRLPRLAANAITFLITMVGWTIFRANSLAQAETFLGAMARPGLASRADTIWLRGDIVTAAIVAAAICATPRLPGFAACHAALARQPARWTVVQMAVALLFVCAVGKAVTDPFKPFLYFRF